MLHLPKSVFRGRVVSYAHVGRSRPILYAAEFRDLPGVVKVGRCGSGWRNRTRGYVGIHGGISACVVFELYEEFSTADLEADVIASMGCPVAFGIEWFEAPLSWAGLVTERVLDAYGLSYCASYADVGRP